MLRKGSVRAIKQLCLELGFLRGTERNRHMLTDKTHAFRRMWRNNDGLLGTGLLNLDSLNVRSDLETMAVAFLESHGEQLWDAESYPPFASFPVYPRDKER